MAVGDWRKDTPEVGHRVEVKTSPWQGVTVGNTIEHHGNKEGKVVWHPDGFKPETDGYYLGPSYGRMWRYLDLPDPKTTAKETAPTMFHPHAVRTKAGWKAQVIFGDLDSGNYEVDDLPVVWEGDVEHNDTTDEKGTTKGQDKAYKAANDAISTAVEALFVAAKIKG